jgi:hypothetical protein
MQKPKNALRVPDPTSILILNLCLLIDVFALTSPEAGEFSSADESPALFPYLRFGWHVVLAAGYFTRN